MKLTRQQLDGIIREEVIKERAQMMGPEEVGRDTHMARAYADARTRSVVPVGNWDAYLDDFMDAMPFAGQARGIGEAITAAESGDYTLTVILVVLALPIVRPIWKVIKRTTGLKATFIAALIGERIYGLYKNHEEEIKKEMEDVMQNNKDLAQYSDKIMSTMDNMFSQSPQSSIARPATHPRAMQEVLNQQGRVIKVLVG